MFICCCDSCAWKCANGIRVTEVKQHNTSRAHLLETGFHNFIIIIIIITIIIIIIILLLLLLLLLCRNT